MSQEAIRLLLAPDASAARRVQRLIAELGANVGKALYGCSRFPGCRGVVAIE